MAAVDPATDRSDRQSIVPFAGNIRVDGGGAITRIEPTNDGAQYKGVPKTVNGVENNYVDIIVERRN